MHRVGFIVPQGFQLMSLAALTAFEIANLPPSGPCYELHLLSEQGGPVLSSSGMTVETEAFADPAFDTVIARHGVLLDLFEAIAGPHQCEAAAMFRLTRLESKSPDRSCRNLLDTAARRSHRHTWVAAGGNEL